MYVWTKRSGKKEINLKVGTSSMKSETDPSTVPAFRRSPPLLNHSFFHFGALPFINMRTFPPPFFRRPLSSAKGTKPSNNNWAVVDVVHDSTICHGDEYSFLAPSLLCMIHLTATSSSSFSSFLHRAILYRCRIKDPLPLPPSIPQSL